MRVRLRYAYVNKKKLFITLCLHMYESGRHDNRKCGIHCNIDRHCVRALELGAAVAVRAETYSKPESKYKQ